MIANYHTKPLIREKFRNMRNRIMNIDWTAGVCWQLLRSIHNYLFLSFQELFNFKEYFSLREITSHDWYNNMNQQTKQKSNKIKLLINDYYTHLDCFSLTLDVKRWISQHVIPLKIKKYVAIDTCFSHLKPIFDRWLHVTEGGFDPRYTHWSKVS